MINIHKKTLEDIEFNTVLDQVAEHSITSLGKAQVLAIEPISNPNSLEESLLLTNEYLASFANDNRIPNHGFEPISHEIKLLNIENSFLETQSFRKISNISESSNNLIKFLEKFKDYYPNLFEFSQSVEATKVIITEIDAIIDKYGDVKDRASDTLYQLRRAANNIKGKINQSFNVALTTSNASDYLDEIKESVVDNRRVLAVKSMHRRKVKGTIMGSSKTGSIVYIEPEATFRYTRELQNLEYDMKEEIERILKQLTNFLRPFIELLKDYQTF